MHIRFHFCSFFKEFDGMLHFEVEIVFVGIRTKAYFFKYLLGSLCLRFFFFLLPFVEEFLIIYDFTYGRVSLSSYLYKVESLIGSKL